MRSNFGFGLLLLISLLASFSDSLPAAGLKTGIGIIDNNVPAVVKDPGIVFRDPVQAMSDLAAKSVMPGFDKIVEKALPEQKKQIANAVLTTGFITRPLGPVGDIITFNVLVQASKGSSTEVRTVPVKPKAPAPQRTPNKYAATVDCLVQRSDNTVEAYSIKSPEGLPADLKGLLPKDIITLKASRMCNEYDSEGAKPVQNVSIVFDGASIDPIAVEGKEYKYYMLGKVT